MPVAETERIDVQVYRVLNFINRKTVSSDRVPQADELELGNSPTCLDLMPLRLRGKRPFKSAKPFTTERVPSVQNFALEELLREFRVNQTLIANQTDEHTDRVSASAESECKDFFIKAAVVARQERVEMPYVLSEPHAECAANQRQRAERGCSDAVVIFCDLVIGG